MKKKIRIFGKEIKRAVRRGLMENIVEQYEMKDTYSKAKYKQSPKEAEIEGVFGQYGEDIPPAVLRYMRKNPKSIIKRLYDVYGQEMFDYISDYANDEGIVFSQEDEDKGDDWSYEEEEVVSEVETMDIEDDVNAAKNKLGDPNYKGTFGYKEADGDIKTVTVNEVNKLFEDKKRGKGCADTKKGCVRKRGNKWIILNNKKGGVWKEGGEFDTPEEANEKLKAIHA